MHWGWYLQLSVREDGAGDPPGCTHGRLEIDVPPRSPLPRAMERQWNGGWADNILVFFQTLREEKGNLDRTGKELATELAQSPLLQ